MIKICRERAIYNFALGVCFTGIEEYFSTAATAYMSTIVHSSCVLIRHPKAIREDAPTRTGFQTDCRTHEIYIISLIILLRADGTIEKEFRSADRNWSIRSIESRSLEISKAISTWNIKNRESIRYEKAIIKRRAGERAMYCPIGC